MKMETIFKLKLILPLFCLGVIATNGANPPVFTAKEKIHIDKLRQAVAGKLTAPYMKSDAYLIKWLKAKDFNHKNAREALEKTLEWRKSVDADNLPNYKFDPDLEKRYVIDLTTAKDKEGRPIVLFPYGDWNIRRKALEGKVSDLSFRLTVTEEKAAQLSYNVTGEPSSLVIADYNGFSVKTHGCPKCIPLYLNWGVFHEQHYPYNFYRLIAINAPRVLDPIVKLLRNVLSKSTSESLLVFGYDRKEQQAEISKHVNLADLPVRFGGTKKQTSQ